MDDTNPYIQKANDLKGMKVVNPEGEDLGKIEELMIDCDNGKIAYAVLSFGGVLGFGDKLFAVPWDALEVLATKNEIVLSVDKEMLEQAPGFDKNNWPDVADRRWQEEVYTYYNFHPYWM